MRSSTSERRACNNEWFLAWTTSEEGVAGCDGHHSSIEVVRIVFGESVSVDDVRLSKALSVYDGYGLIKKLTKAVLLERAPAALLIAYCGLRRSRFVSWPLVLVKIGVLGSGAGAVRGGGIFCSTACSKGLSQGRLQNYMNSMMKNSP